jgi:hypothetical protein
LITTPVAYAQAFILYRHSTALFLNSTVHDMKAPGPFR